MRIGVVGDQAIGDIDHLLRAAAALDHGPVEAGGSVFRPVADAFRVRMLKAVDRLVVVADDADRGAGAEPVDNGLLRHVQVLVLVDEEVRVLFALRRVSSCR